MEGVVDRVVERRGAVEEISFPASIYAMELRVEVVWKVVGTFVNWRFDGRGDWESLQDDGWW